MPSTIEDYYTIVIIKKLAEENTQSIIRGIRILDDLLSERTFPEQLFKQCLRDFHKKVYTQERFMRKITRLKEVISLYENNVLARISELPSTDINQIIPYYGRQITIHTGLYCHYQESNNLIFTHYCTYYPVPQYESQVSVLIPSTETLRTAVIMRLKENIKNY